MYAYCHWAPGHFCLPRSMLFVFVVVAWWWCVKKAVLSKQLCLLLPTHLGWMRTPPGLSVQLAKKNTRGLQVRAGAGSVCSAAAAAAFPCPSPLLLLSLSLLLPSNLHWSVSLWLSRAGWFLAFLQGETEVQPARGRGSHHPHLFCDHAWLLHAASLSLLGKTLKSSLAWRRRRR